MYNDDINKVREHLTQVLPHKHKKFIRNDEHCISLSADMKLITTYVHQI